jgi:hypothetical protein
MPSKSSKINQPRFWKLWRKNGAVAKMTGNEIFVSPIKFNPGIDEISTDNFPQTLNSNTRIALDTKEWVSAKSIFTQKYYGKVMNHDSTFHLSIKPMLFGGKLLRKTFILNIDSTESENVLCSQLPLGGFASYSFTDYAAAGDHIATQFCKLNGLGISAKQSHWPLLQYVVVIPERV